MDLQLSKFESNKGPSLMDPDTGDLYYTSGRIIHKITRNSDKIESWLDRLNTLKHTISNSRINLQNHKKELLLNSSTTNQIKKLENDVETTKNNLIKFLVESQVNHAINDEEFNNLRREVNQTIETMNTNKDSATNLYNTYNLLLEKTKDRHNVIGKNNLMESVLQKTGLSGLKFEGPTYVESVPEPIKNIYVPTSTSTDTDTKKSKGARSARSAKSARSGRSGRTIRVTKVKVPLSDKDIETKIIALHEADKDRGRPLVAELKEYMTSNNIESGGFTKKKDLIRIAYLSIMKRNNEEGPEVSSLDFDTLKKIKKEFKNILRENNTKDEHPNGITGTNGTVLKRVRLVNIGQTLQIDDPSARIVIIHGALDLLDSDLKKFLKDNGIMYKVKNMSDADEDENGEIVILNNTDIDGDLTFSNSSSNKQVSFTLSNGDIVFVGNGLMNKTLVKVTITIDQDDE